jgi:hypothetical protein
MENERLIHEYLEGELNPLLADRLFSELAINQDLRSEFGRQLQINKLTKEDMCSITVPAKESEELFAKLGFSMPSKDNATKISLLTNLRNTLTSARIRYSTVAALALAISSGVYFMKDNNAEIAVEKISKPTHTYQNSITPMPSSTEPSSSDNIDNTNSGVKSLNKKRSFNTFSANKTSDNNRDLAKSADNAETVESTNNRSSYAPAPTLAYSPVHSFAPMNLRFGDSKREFPIYRALELSSDYRDSKFEISWSRASVKEKAINALPDKRSDFFGNKITALYKINNEHAVGLEFGEDSFYQEFDYFNGEQTTKYKQAPTYFWLAGAYRFSPEALQIADIATPYAKIALGGAKGGVIGKLGMGFNFSVSPTINAFIGGEYGSFIYNVGNSTYISDKFSLVYGASINL